MKLPIAFPTFDPKAGPPCHECPARCCRYFALEIDRPADAADHDKIRWFLLHQGVSVWVQDGEWHLEIQAPCRELLPDGRCAIYETRPQICREYGWPDAEAPHEPACDYFSDGTGYDLYFGSANDFDAWSRAELAGRERRLAARREGRRRRTEARRLEKEATA